MDKSISHNGGWWPTSTSTAATSSTGWTYQLVPLAREEFVKIESIEYACKVGVVSGTRSFMWAVRESEEYFDLVDAVRCEMMTLGEIIRRFGELLDRRGNPKYQHPYDTALAVYQIAIHELAPGSIDPEAHGWLTSVLRELNGK